MDYIHNRLGHLVKKIELSDDDIIKCLQNETLITMSLYYPFFIEYKLDTNANRMENSNNMFYLPNDIEGHKLLSVASVQTGTAYSNGWTGGNPYNIIGNSIHNSIMGYNAVKLNLNVTSALTVPETFSFIPPNLLRLYSVNFRNQYYMCIFKMTHREDFATFHIGLREIIRNLAFYDVCIDLYGVRKYFSQINTLFAEIQLETSMLEDAIGKREEVLEKLKHNMLLSTHQRKIFIG